MSTDSIVGSNFIATFMWFTPSPLFIFVNIVIGTIALVSRFAAVAPKTQTHQQKPLQRLNSFNLRHYNHHNESTFVTQPESDSDSTHPQLAPKPSLFQRVLSFNLNKDEPAQPESVNPSTELIKPQPSSGLDQNTDFGDEENSKKAVMRKSASEKECSMTFDWEEEEEDEETVERRRPATALARSETMRSKEEDEADDAKADDFINMFKNQLRLQRLDSFIRNRNTNTI